MDMVHEPGIAAALCVSRVPHHQGDKKKAGETEEVTFVLGCRLWQVPVSGEPSQRQGATVPEGEQLRPALTTAGAGKV